MTEAGALGRAASVAEPGVTIGPAGDAILRKVTWRLVPFMAVLYFINYLDRVNVGFAALTMNRDLGFSATVYGNGAGILFLGYVLFQVPSNLALERIGTRIWVAVIMVVWGVMSGAMALVTGPVSFYVLRFLLGVAEAGFFPGMILYLTYWFPEERRAKMTAAFMMAIPLSSFFGAPVSTTLLDAQGFGLAGWQWLFVLQGIPAVVLGLLVPVMLTDRPEYAGWLQASERHWLAGVLAAERHARDARHDEPLGRALVNPHIWAFGVVYFGFVICNYGLTLWLPQIVKSFGGLTNLQVGLLTAIPYALSSVAMYAWCAHADARGERTWHTALAILVGGIGLIISAFQIGNPAVAFIALCVGAVGTYSGLPVSWSLPTAVLGSRVAAGGIALVNAIGNTGGYFGPAMVGRIHDATGSYTGGLLLMATFAVLSGVLAVALRPGKQAEHIARGRAQ